MQKASKAKEKEPIDTNWVQNQNTHEYTPPVALKKPTVYCFC